MSLLYTGTTNLFQPYKRIEPVPQRATYNGDQPYVDFYLSLVGQKAIPGSFYLIGRKQIYATGTTPPNGYTDVYYDPVAGDHGLIDQVQTFINGAVRETLENYGRSAKGVLLATLPQDSLGTETDNSVSGICATRQIAKGLCEGTYPNDTQSDYEDSTPFCIPLQFCLNNVGAPIALVNTRIRITLATAAHYLQGQDFDIDNTNYQLTNLNLCFKVMPDDGTRTEVPMIVYQCIPDTLTSNEYTVQTSIPSAPVLAVHGSLISVANESDPTGKSNYLQCMPPPGVPPYPNDLTVNTGHYGIVRMLWGVNDYETAIVGSTIQSREEILQNALDSYGSLNVGYNSLIRRMQDPTQPDGYIIGLDFGGPQNLDANSFSLLINSLCDNDASDPDTGPYRIYLFFKTLETIVG